MKNIEKSRMNYFLLYVQLSSDDREKCAVFEKMMAAYVKELDEHEHDPMPEGFLQKWIKSILSMQGPSDRHLELCYDGADKMYLTADPVTGRPFWEAMGFLATGERSPENKMEIYEKPVPQSGRRNR